MVGGWAECRCDSAARAKRSRPGGHDPFAQACATAYGAGQLRAYAQSLNDCPSEASADGVASLTTPVPRSIWVGLPAAMVCVAPPEVYVEVGPKWTVPTLARTVCATSVGASRIH